MSIETEENDDTVSDYVVAVSSTMSDLCDRVSFFLNNGYACQGGICVNTLQNGTLRYYQALVKKGDTNNVWYTP